MAAATCSTRFCELEPALPQVILNVLDGMGFDRTTPVQAATIPLFMSNKDVAVEAVTGSGKTLAFVLPLVEMLRRLEEPLKRHQVGAVIVSPTRELAAQIYTVALPFVATLPGLRAALLVGGTEVAADLATIKEEGANILIGTPGRLDDIMQRSACLDLRRLEVLVLDEADRLLDMGFQTQLTAILQRLPKQRRTGLFSATQTQAVEELARAGLRNPVRVEVRTSAAAAKPSAPAPPKGGSRMPAGLALWYVRCEAEAKPAQLAAFLAEHAASQKCLVYLLTCACVDYWATVLPRLPALRHLSMASLHGKMKQSVREKTLAEFAAKEAGALFCTDVAARGLDIPGVDWILQFDPPQDPNAFVHRVGRTARMGREGNALLFLLPKEDPYVDFLRLRGIALKEKAEKEGAGVLTEQLRGEAMADRDMLEKGTKAFVSFVRGYREHQCRYIFRMKELPLGRVGMAFGLLQLPSMPELRGKGKASAAGFTPPQNLKLDAIRFKEKGREKQRQQRLVAAKAQPREQQRRVKKGSKTSLESGVEAELGGEEATRGDAWDSEEDDLDEDYRMLKKLKKGKISERQFVAEVAGEDLREPTADGEDIEKSALASSLTGSLQKHVQKDRKVGQKAKGPVQKSKVQHGSRRPKAKHKIREERLAGQKHKRKGTT